MIPIIGSLEQAPEGVDCWWFTENCWQVVRSGIPAWVLSSTSGWNTKAARYATIRACEEARQEWLTFPPNGPVYFAPTAEDAIRAYHADPALCPFGEIHLAEEKITSDVSEFCFRNKKCGRLLRFRKRFWSIESSFGDPKELPSITALCKEVTDWWSDPTHSTIGRWIAEQKEGGSR